MSESKPPQAPAPEQKPPIAIPGVAKMSRLDTFVLGILAAEVQRRGTGISPGTLVSIKDLAIAALKQLEN